MCVCADYVFTEHKRSVNRVVFHSVEANQLLSGSQDGTMKLHVCLVDLLVNLTHAFFFLVINLVFACIKTSAEDDDFQSLSKGERGGEREKESFITLN